jgi:hypothetical protein
MTPEENAFVEAIRAQRTEALDAGARWFAAHVAGQERIKELEAKVKELTPPEAPKLEAVT